MTDTDIIPIDQLVKGTQPSSASAPPTEDDLIPMKDLMAKNPPMPTNTDASGGVSPNQGEPTTLGFGGIAGKALDAVFNRLPADIRERIRVLGSTGDIAKANQAADAAYKNPASSQDFQNEGISNVNKSLDETGVSKLPEGPQTAIRFVAGLPASVGGAAKDFATSPGQLGLAAATEGLVKGIAPTEAGQAISKVINTPIEDMVSGASSKAGSLVDKAMANVLRGGVPEQEAARIQQQYGSSNAGLVDKVKEAFAQKSAKADQLFDEAFKSAPDDVKINPQKFKDALDNGIETLQLSLGKDHPLVNTFMAMRGDISEAGNVSKVVDQYGEPIINTSKELSPISKDQLLETRNTLNRLFGNDPNINRVIQGAKNGLYDSASDSGFQGIKEARTAYRTAREMEDKFFNANGDLKMANEQALNRIGVDGKFLPKQQLDHIRELEQYTGQPIIKDATNINKLNKAREVLKNAKQWGKGAAATAVVGEVGRKALTGKW